MKSEINLKLTEITYDSLGNMIYTVRTCNLESLIAVVNSILQVKPETEIRINRVS